MIYPDNYEKKIGFENIRCMLRGNCLCQLGCDEVDRMSFMVAADDVCTRLAEVREFRRVLEEVDDFPLQCFYDSRQSVSRLRLKGTYMEEQELFELMQSLRTIGGIKYRLRPEKTAEASDGVYIADYPTLWQLAKSVRTFREAVRRIGGILDKYGHIKDSASSVLYHIRQELRHTEGSISHTLSSILRQAQQEGLVERDVKPTMRDGRLVIPVAPAMKRKIQGIVHDESATGKTLFIEPTAVVEANNRIRELEAEERREIIRILTEISDVLRPDAEGMLEALEFLGKIDFIQAKAKFAEEFACIEPEVKVEPHLDWNRAVHPLLRNSLLRQGKDVVPLDITIDRGLLIISGPNAGGKSVCLKTVGLLQYMMQCGVSVPVGERSVMGIFSNIMIDIGDEQSIEDDLSTYSSHLRNMKMMIRHADKRTLLLIDEFGTGTEPQIGGAIAEAVLRQFWKKKAWGVITTHYQNLKHFAEDHPGVVNGAMLYDRHEMKALFQLQIGRPGSSFAIEIARKTGLPEDVIKDASEIVGQDYIQSDKYLQDIVRDKRYWEQKRQTVHQREKDVERTITRFEESVEEIDKERKAILRRAKEQAEELIKEANRRIENTIREIRETEAEKEATKRLREEMAVFREEVSEIDTKANDALIEKKMKQILARRERREKRKENRDKGAPVQGTPKDISEIGTKSGEQQDMSDAFMREGNYVRIKGTKSVGIIDSIQGKYAIVLLGDMKTKMSLDRLEADKGTEKKAETIVKVPARMTRDVIDEHRSRFRPEIDVRGMRGDEALLAVQRFVDDAILVGTGSVRILHGKGNGILRQLVREYLSGVPNVTDYRDEHVQFGGAGITVVEIS